MRHAQPKLNRVLAAVLSVLAALALITPVWAGGAQFATLSLPVEKIVEGDAPPSSETFSFTLSAVTKDAPMPSGGDTLTLSGSGAGTFGVLTYTHAGDYVYRIQESAGNAAGYAYDQRVYTVTVHVTTQAGGLKAVWTAQQEEEKANAICFINTYRSPGATPPENTGTLTLSNTVVGALAEPHRLFTFTVQFMDADGTLLTGNFPYTGYGVPGGSISSGGTIQLAHGQSIVIRDLPLGVTYQIVEQEADQNGYFTSAQSASGTLFSLGNVSAWINYKMGVGDPEPVQVPLAAQKLLDGASPQGSQFIFLLRDESGHVMQSVSNTGSLISFAPITFVQPGVYTYYLSEQAGEGNFTYDTAVHTVSVQVTQNGRSLNAQVSYDGVQQMPVFSNTTRAGSGSDLRTITISKVWEDDDDGAGKRPGRITVTLLRNGKELKTISIGAADGWQVSLSVPDGGVYSLSESQTNNYMATITGSSATGFVLTNRYVEEVTPPSVPHDPENPDRPTVPGLVGQDENTMESIQQQQNPLSQAPATGDTSLIRVWAVLLCISGAGLGICLGNTYRKKRKNR